MLEPLVAMRTKERAGISPVLVVPTPLVLVDSEVKLLLALRLLSACMKRKLSTLYQ